MDHILSVDQKTKRPRTFWVRGLLLEIELLHLHRFSSGPGRDDAQPNAFRQATAHHGKGGKE
ncbi:MAG: hypothetical protein IV085_06540 [Thiobacillus sp.]|nr:hypothetical protein [Thiobacillus sp.]